MKMPKALKTKWVKALRSGKYKQGKYTLYSPREGNAAPKFCCLGVLEHCAMNGKVESMKYDSIVEYKAVPSPDFYKQFGITDINDGEFNVLTAMHMNDAENRRFKTIANMIEKHVETD